ncbi:LysR family transcriptional regulator [Phytohalomonas tamaricis]|uniref:LysR family transcriptional regulator n=1 Tax=Phytohalomonas tamaricis TaxID=2081032 RepID=UPI000D0B094B|nr:LysR family transcriptional regulator [Phytohalomonas tamaricis]
MNYDTLPLNALRAFEATARLGSVTAAAQELNVTHGAVSRQLRTLDEHFGVALFVKVGRGLKLTDHGAQLHSGVGEAFTRLRDSCLSLKREVEGAPFTLACPGSFLARWFIPRLDRLHRELPELRLHVFSSEAELDPRRDDVSATLTFAAPPWPTDMTVIELAPERIGAVISPHLASQLDATRADTLFACKLLHTASRPQAWPQWGHAQGLDPTRLAHAQAQSQGFEHLYYLLEAAVAGLGVAIAPQLLVADDLHNGRLIAPWGFIETDARICLWLPRHVSDRRGQRLADWLVAELGGDNG